VTRGVEHSAIYRGVVRHRRYEPVRHDLRMPLCMLYLDLAELDAVFDRRLLWSRRRPALGRWRRGDYFGDAETPLDEAVRGRVEEETGRRPAGPIRMLTHVRYWGYIFNPVTFYYCFDASGSSVESVLAEITNTPWKQRHAYVVQRGGAAGHDRAPVRGRFAKTFHVSPFMAMEQQYDWTFSAPGDRLGVHMRNFERGGRVFDATLALERRPLTGGSLNALLVRYPAMTLQVIANIHIEALRLWLKGTPVVPHPDRSGERTEAAL
jgi:DUF1365 family protein